MRRILFAFMIIALVAVPVFAQDAPSELEDGAASLGMYYMAGEFSMIGLSFHQWLGNHGIMVSAGLDSSHTSALAEYQYSIFSAHLTETLNSHLYVWAAGGVNFRTDSTYNQTTTFWDDETHINAVASLGIGVEFVWWRHLSVPIQFGYVAEFPYDIGMSFCFASGIRYRF